MVLNVSKKSEPIELVEVTSNKTKSTQKKILPKTDNKNHRNRVKSKALANGFSTFSDYELLEYLLFHSIPRIDTKKLAKQLLNDFGSLSKVFEAPANELKEYLGVGDYTVTMFMAFMELTKRFHADKNEHSNKMTFDSSEKFGKFFINQLYSYSEEVVFLMFLDNRRKMISCDLLFVGEYASINVNPKVIIQNALKYKATFIAIAHNHTHGDYTPSEGDVRVTRALRKDLKVIDVLLVDHIIVTQTDYLSMVEGNYI